MHDMVLARDNKQVSPNLGPLSVWLYPTSTEYLDYVLLPLNTLTIPFPLNTMTIPLSLNTLTLSQFHWILWFCPTYLDSIPLPNTLAWSNFHRIILTLSPFHRIPSLCPTSTEIPWLYPTSTGLPWLCPSSTEYYLNSIPLLPNTLTLSHFHWIPWLYPTSTEYLDYVPLPLNTLTMSHFHWIP